MAVKLLSTLMMQACNKADQLRGDEMG